MDVTRYLELKPAHEWLLERAAERAERVRYHLRAADGTPTTVTWRAHAEAVLDLAGFVHAEGLDRGARAAIFAPNRLEWITAALGVQAGGLVMVPIYPSSTADQAAYVAEHSEAELLFVDTEALLERVFSAWSRYASVRRLVLLDDGLDPFAVAARIEGGPAPAELEARCCSWSTAMRRGAEARRAAAAAVEARVHGAALSDLSIMLYTSGTSGRPKGVPLTHANLQSNQEGWLRAMAPLLDEGAVDLLWLPMSHIFGYGEACIGNQVGFETHLVTPAEVLDRMAELRPQVFFSVPSYWEKIAAHPAGVAAVTGGQLRFCLSGGAGLKVAVKEQLLAAGVLIIEGYGLTECSPTLTLNRPDDYRFDSVGKPLSTVELRLAEDGEILARGPNVFAGYHRDPVATAEAFTEDGWFKTGDIGRLTDDGFLQIVDRKKDILVTAGGKNVPPANIELRFKDEPSIEHLVVYGDGRKFLVAAVWPTPGAEPAAIEAAIARVNAELASYETIKRHALVTDRPLTVEGGLLTPTLKLKRKRVYQEFSTVFEGLYA
jgi:long-chain acyl-CoA synthetase